MNHHVRLDGNRLKFVLSTGRTGTTQLREYLKKNFRELSIWFEPPPSRQLYLLWNAEQAGFVPKELPFRLLRKSKTGKTGLDTASTIVEFDSYLSPLVCDLIQHVDCPHIIHMVRHPFDWIMSIHRFKAASWRKYAVDVVPFTYIVHPDARGAWRELNKLQRLAWSWRYINERILEQKSLCSQYKLCKFEHFTSQNRDTRIQTIRNILSVIDPGFTGNIPDIDIHTKLNKSDNQDHSGWHEWTDKTQESINEICAPLMELFDYRVQDDDHT